MEKKEQPIGATEEVGGKLQNLQQNGAATVSELREFLASMRGKNPKEALGIIAQSRLVRSMAVSTVACIVLLVVLTLVPYAMQDESKLSVKDMLKGKPKAAAPAQPADTAAATATPTDDSSKTTIDPKAAATKMGIDELKNAPPDKNPLEDKLDDLLDGKE